MTDPVEQDLKEYLRGIEKADNRRHSLEERYDTVRENIEHELNEITDLLNPFYKMDYKSKLDVFATRLHEVAEMAEELAKEFGA
jgi:hypothetical protein